MKLRKLKTYVHEHGFRSSVVLTMDRLLHRKIPVISYEKWLERNRPSSEDYAAMEKTKLSRNPLIGVAASVDKEDRAAFMQSLDLQAYRNYRALKNCPDAEYVLVVEGSCTLRPDLLWECARRIAEDSDNKIALFYFDSDSIGEDGRKCDPAFRPDYDPDLLEQVNYMGSVFLVRADLVRSFPAPKNEEDAIHLFLQHICKAAAADGGDDTQGVVVHIPEVLYHKLSDPGPADDAENTQAAGSKEGFSDNTANQPLVSIMIPNKDHVQDLERCVDSLLTENTWENMEIFIIENNSQEEETFEFYQKLQERDERIKVVTWEGPFNYSAINNYGSLFANGEYLLLLNNDTQILKKDSIEALVELASDPGVGAVGALLLYPDGTVQHAGIILGHGGIAGHAWEGEDPDTISGSFQPVVFHHTHNVSAVTGACMMLRRDVYLQAGGLDESLEVTFNDVDLCLRLRKAGKRILMCPEALLAHYESSSRGSEDSPEKVERFHREISIFVHRWERELEAGDPFYNPNMTLIGRSWTCRDRVRESTKPYVKYLHLEEET